MWFALQFCAGVVSELLEDKDLVLAVLVPLMSFTSFSTGRFELSLKTGRGPESISLTSSFYNGGPDLGSQGHDLLQSGSEMSDLHS